MAKEEMTYQDDASCAAPGTLVVNPEAMDSAITEELNAKLLHLEALTNSMCADGFTNFQSLGERNQNNLVWCVASLVGEVTALWSAHFLGNSPASCGEVANGGASPAESTTHVED